MGVQYSIYMGVMWHMEYVLSMWLVYGIDVAKTYVKATWLPCISVLQKSYEVHVGLAYDAHIQ